MRSEPYQPIENYGIIGNLQTVALVGMHGSIDFLSFPVLRFAHRVRRAAGPRQGRPLPDRPRCWRTPSRNSFILLGSNILLSRFLAPEGVAEISDFMPVSMKPPGEGEEDIPTQLVRRVKTVRGEVRYRMVCAPRFNYGQLSHKVDQVSDHEIVFSEEGDGKLVLRLRSLDVPIHYENGDGVAEFTLRAGEKAGFVLEDRCAPASPPPCEAEHLHRALVQGNDELLALVDRAQHVQGPLARDG